MLVSVTEITQKGTIYFENSNSRPIRLNDFDASDVYETDNFGEVTSEANWNWNRLNYIDTN